MKFNGDRYYIRNDTSPFRAAANFQGGTLMVPVGLVAQLICANDQVAGHFCPHAQAVEVKNVAAANRFINSQVTFDHRAAGVVGRKVVNLALVGEGDAQDWACPAILGRRVSMAGNRCFFIVYCFFV